MSSSTSPWATAAVAGAAGLAVGMFLGRRMGNSRSGALAIPRGQEQQAASVRSQAVLRSGNVAVIVGAAGGIGRAVVLRCARLGMKVVIADIDEKDASAVRAECLAAGIAPDSVIVVKCDVRCAGDLAALKEETWKAFGACHFLMNNAGIQTNGQCSPYGHPDRWKRIIETNLLGVYYGGLAFAEAMIAQQMPCIIVNTGSKQGITAPPGDAAYNVSKAGVKYLTEAMQHKLRSTPGCQVNAFLLVPGFTATMIQTRGKQWLEGSDFDPSKAQNDQVYDGVPGREAALAKWKARGAWAPDDVVDELFKAIDAGTPFYIICQDHETTREQDQGRMQWAFDDVLFRRAPLSRWSDQYKDEFKQVSAHFV